MKGKSERHIWSPWRSEHMDRFRDGRAEADDLNGLFEAIGKSDDDEKNLVVWRGKTVFVLMNLYPYNSGHLLVAPFRRVGRLQELTGEERNELMSAVTRAMDWIDEVLDPEGYNVGLNQGKAAGAGIPGHLHFHVVPRWLGDTNFMPTIADITVVPQSMTNTYELLKKAASSAKASADQVAE